MAAEQKIEGALTREKLIEWLEPVVDPDIHMSIVGMGLIYDAVPPDENGRVQVTMTLTSLTCPVGPQLMNDVKTRLLILDEIKDAEVILTFEPPWDPTTMASDEVKDMLGIW